MRTTIQLILLLAAGEFAVAFCQTNGLVVLTAPAKMEWRKNWLYLRISDTKHSYEFPWGCPPHYSHTGVVSLETNHVYTFTVMEEESNLIPKRLQLTNILIPQVIRIEDRGKLVWDREVCEIHKTKMDFKEVKIAYGFPIPEPRDPTADQELRLFPHRREVASGGCALMPDSPKRTKIYVCNACKQAYEDWKQKQKP